MRKVPELRVDLWNECYILALNSHWSQQRKYTGESYINHPLAVSDILREAMLPIEVICAGVLHDTIEDTETDYEDIEKINKEIADIVLEVTNVYTKEAYPDLNRKKRNELERVRLATVSENAQNVKAADMINNLHNIVTLDPVYAEQYIEEKELLLPLLTKANTHLINTLDVLIRHNKHELSKLGTEI